MKSNQLKLVHPIVVGSHIGLACSCGTQGDLGSSTGGVRLCPFCSLDVGAHLNLARTIISVVVEVQEKSSGGIARTVHVRCWEYGNLIKSCNADVTR